ncbi:hypothetical protein LUZ60_011333 [Juncus effusus]|nr:hypothetical protein LUZ60_011333 [Juncus effusus]
MDRLALIPFSRVCDFLRGESNNEECPTRFHVEARRKRPTKTACKAKVDGVLEYILYWCSFGPDDHRKGGSVRPSRIYTPKSPSASASASKSPKSPGRPNQKRGCTCHFIVKRLLSRPSVALVIYNKYKHVDKDGLPCHGLTLTGSKSKEGVYAPGISEGMRIRVLSLLNVGVSVESIMAWHGENVERNGGPANRDDLLTHRCVRRMERKMRRETLDLDSDDAASIKTWVQNNQNQVFFYEDFSDSDTFALGIQTDWQLEQMVKFGNKRLLASDSKFGSNKLKNPLYSLVVFDSEGNAIPVAWIIMPNFANGEIHKWIGALYNRARTKDASWQLGGFVSDDPSADLFIIREIFQCSVLISFWRVRHAWHKNIIKKCSKIETRAEIMKRLGEIIYEICSGSSNSSDISLFEAFIQEFSHCAEFSEYFKATWYPRLALWIQALKSLPIATSETSSALENYHRLLNLRLINPKTDSEIYQNRTDWLVHELCTKVHSYFWLDNFPQKDSFSRYSKTEWKNHSTPFQEALTIPIADVTIENNCRQGRVVCQKDRDKIHYVRNINMLDFALCDCGFSMEGYICKHAIGLIRVCRERGLVGKSLSRVCYERALRSVLECGERDSLVRDHAIGLMVRVRAQLGSLFEEREREDREREERERERKEREREERERERKEERKEERESDVEEIERERKRERKSDPEERQREGASGFGETEGERESGLEERERQRISAPEEREGERESGLEERESERNSAPEERVPVPEGRERERESDPEERENGGNNLAAENVIERENEGTERNGCTDIDADAIPMDLDPPAGDESVVRKAETKENENPEAEKISEKVGGVYEKLNEKDLPEGSIDERNKDSMDMEEFSGPQKSIELVLKKCNSMKKADVAITNV